MRYGFAIDQRTCIGCHACTVACKTEHEVPLGQFRTWVKYVESGEFPAPTRDFGVMRCNHCTDAPCVKICPTQALFKRDDGIVDFDNERCIGCKACMQGCPYDAIYIDEETHTAAKCNFCAHRVDEGLEPACVVVCPTHSIWVGDLEDPASGIARLVNCNPVQVRAPEQNTGPNVFYLGADRAVLDPLAAPTGKSYLWARPDEHRRQVSTDLPTDPVSKARTTLNTAHARPWGWRVTAYLWTKAVAAGAMLITALAYVAGIDLGVLGSVAAPAIAVAGVGLTAVLLVWDLKRPERFLYILLKPNPRSWLFWGAVVLGAAGALFTAWLALGLLDHASVLSTDTSNLVRSVLSVPTILAAAMTTGYTGFLFGQAEGRDLWQSPLLFWHLIVQAFMVGAGALSVAATVIDPGPAGWKLLLFTLTVATAGHVVMVLLEFLGRHPSGQAAAAAHMVVKGRYAREFWVGGVALAVLAAVLSGMSWAAAPLAFAALGGLVAQGALIAYESVFVRAGQDVPLS
ncbi:4Fe-4S dicluster domain-containing protein [Mycobacterium sherrisii]|uniref:4Fe-4S dicluster domain-containing protein n=1 Tax=Mycobacterium sherrisii TaxID=243061 RepID=UPI002DDCD5D9|nr:4Fe-4S dicluster domain-containing protein [Mycobacterium sherrisii]MEC4764326.1 4Fe-4S dicluster domain-containing protein [Mycobacterium sherrisii]